jgi:hypothetical protein
MRAAAWVGGVAPAFCACRCASKVCHLYLFLLSHYQPPPPDPNPESLNPNPQPTNHRPPGAGPEWRFVDVLPSRAGKGAALDYVLRKLGFDAASTVACGDGANDLQMLRRARLAICVGNSQPEVLAWAAAARRGGGGEGDGGAGDGDAGEGGGEGAWGGEGGKRVFVAKPEAEAAAGILEGLAALGFI